MSKQKSDIPLDITEALAGLDLSEVEVRVYQACLSLGPRPASIVAEKAGLKRGHTYNVLTSLREKGIVQEMTKGSVRHFSVCSPSSLLGMMENRLGDLAERKRKLETALPELEKLVGGISRPPRVRFYQGTHGIREIFEDILRSPVKEMCSIVDLEYSWSSYDKDMRHWVKSFIARREAKDMWWKAIAVKSDVSSTELKRRSGKKRKVKMIEGVQIPAEITIYGNKVAMTSTVEEMIGVVIENDQIVETFRNLHRHLWSILPDYKG